MKLRRACCKNNKFPKVFVIKWSMKTIKDKYPLLFQDTEDKERKIKYEKALKDAKVIADILKEQFGATEVRVFGSLSDRTRFSSLSDIDIAEKGIPPEKFYAAYGAITRGISEFKIDLVDMDDCKETIKKEIIKNGVIL